MNPGKAENIAAVLDRRLSNQQKVEAVSAIPEDPAAKEQQLLKLSELIQRAKHIAKPWPDGKPESLETDGRKQANFRTDRRPVVKTDEGQLSVDFFIYSPRDERYGASICATWYLPGKSMPRVVLQEYVSTESFEEGLAAYRPDVQQKLGLIEESLDFFEQSPPALPDSND